MLAPTAFTLNKVKVTGELVVSVSVTVIVSALPDCSATNIELIIDALKSASVGAVYNVVAEAVSYTHLTLPTNREV